MDDPSPPPPPPPQLPRNEKVGSAKASPMALKKVRHFTTLHSGQYL